MPFSCKLCESNNGDNIEVVDHKQKSKLPISICNQCGLVQQSIIPTDEELNIYYSHNYRMDYKNTYTPKMKHIRKAGLVALDRISFLKRCSINFHANAKLIDIGSGGGELVYLARKYGFDATGIEPCNGYSNFAKTEYGVEILTSVLDDLMESSADIVTIFHVFEHMANPLTVMKKISEILKVGGLLFVEVPNILQDDASPHNKFFKAHLYYYSRYTLIACASKHFDVIKVEDNGNLRVLFRKKEIFSEHIKLPSQEQVNFIINSFKNKGWLNYLFKGKGIFKPINKIKNLLIELRLNNIPPKLLLDSLHKRL